MNLESGLIKIKIQRLIELKLFQECFFHEVHINKDNQISGEALYCFNRLNISNGNKILYHTYSLFCIIYEEVEQIFSNANVNMYYSEAKSEQLALTVNFAADIEVLILILLYY